MKYGLQVWDENGKTILDTSFSTVKILKVIKGVNQSSRVRVVNFSHPLLAKNNPFYNIRPLIVTSDMGEGAKFVSVVISGDRATITFDGATNNYDFSDHTVTIGVY